MSLSRLLFGTSVCCLKNNEKYSRNSRKVFSNLFLENPEKFYNNNMESINELLKYRQNYKNLDYYKFVQGYEELLQEQESNVLRAFLKFDSSFEVRSEFSHHKLNFTTPFAILEPSKKEDVKNKLLNVLVDEESYANVIGHNANTKAIYNAKKNLMLVLDKIGDNDATTMENTQDNEASSNDASRNVKLNDCSLANETLRDIDFIVFLLAEALPNVDRNSLIGMVQKSLELVRTDSIKPGFLNGQYFVKSQSNGAPHNVPVTENIQCDQACPRYKDDYYCSHALSVKIIENALHRYAQPLSRIVRLNLTAIASKDVG